MDSSIVRTTTISTPDGRSLELYLAGPEDGHVLLFHTGTPSAALPYGPAVREMVERGIWYVAFNRPGYGSSTRRAGRSIADVVEDSAHGEWLAANIPTAIPHLFDDEGHLSIAVTSFGAILDELMASAGVSGAVS